jgi:TolB protein
VVFNRSAGDSYDAMDATVKVVSAAGGNPIDLTAVNTSIGNSWPKWAPFVHSFGGATIFWLTFSSRRPYGLRGGSNSQLWMTAVDIAELANGVDGSHPPFWLPFQDFTTGNHIAQWAETVERAPCTERAGDCMPSEVCVRGVCVPR